MHAHSPPAPTATVLTPEQAASVDRLVDGLDGAGLWWLSGYAAGLARGRASSPRPQLAAVEAALPVAASPIAVVPAPAPATGPQRRLTLVYGSQTGNARRVAEALAAQVAAAGLAVRLLRADAYPLRELADEHCLAVVISTQGDGEPPDDARDFVEHVLGKRAPRLPRLRFGVLGLGDSSYPQFCAIGQALDARLEALGASRWIARGDADLDIDSVASPWLAAALAAARETLADGARPDGARPERASPDHAASPSPLPSPSPPLASVTALHPHAPAATAPTAVADTSAHGRERPFAAELLLNQRITGAGSDRDIRHLELSLAGSGLHYQPGDALGVWPLNPPRLVDAVLATLALDGEQPVAHAGHELPLREWLSSRRELTRLTRPLLAAHAQRAGSASLQALLAPGDADGLARLLATRQLIDLLRAWPAAWSGPELVAALRALTPRLYSIASSASAVGEEAHLTVAHVEYAVDGDTRWGAASDFLARAAEGERVPVFIEPNERFRLPADPARDVIMIGPGTGVAPFRGFVQERAATGARGRHWLLFGNPHARTDFLYQTEWQHALRRGQLDRLDVAFSRDQADKVYVQHRLREHGRRLYAWLQDGAHLYVCGDAARMARDVHAALVAVIAEHGGVSADAARETLADLQRQGRYARDVY